MNQIIPIKNDNNNLTVLGRDLHKFLEIETRYDIWFKRMLKYNFEENIDYIQLVQKSSSSKSNNSNYINHQLTINMAKEISMIQRNSKGKEARKYFIECERKLKEQVMNNFNLPQNYEEALKHLLVQVQENKKQKLILKTTQKRLAGKTGGITTSRNNWKNKYKNLKDKLRIIESINKNMRTI